MDWTVNADSKKHLPFEDTDKEHLQFEENDHSYGIQFADVIPVIRGTGGFCTMERVSEDWSAEVKQENLAVVKQEPDDVRRLFILYSVYHHNRKNMHLFVTDQIL